MEMTSIELGSRSIPPVTMIGEEDGNHVEDRERFRTP